MRLPPPERPATLLGLAGALQFARDSSPPYFPFLARPGPEVPYVLPAVLSCEGVVAVVSALLIGEHAGFTIAYFAKPGTDITKVPPIDEWGSDRAFRRDANGKWTFGESTTDENSFDYEIAPWIERGKLQWIEPYDRSLEVKTGLAGCPYPGQPGHREVTRIEDLEVWWPSEPPEE